MSGGVRNVLVVGPGVGDVTDELCARLSTGVHPTETALGVTVVQSPDDRRRRWERFGSLDGIATDFVDIQSTTRAASAHADTSSTVPPTSVQRVEDPTDLAAINRAITARLDAADGTTTLCFHSLTDLLNYVETERALEFLHALAEAVTAAGAYAHYHLDVDAHDAETIELFGTVTDRVIELSRDGSDVSIA